MMRWPLLGLAVVGAFILGVIGFGLFAESRLQPATFTDNAYLSLQLFVLESGNLSGAPWQLQVARFLAPATTGVALAAALAAVVGEGLAAVRLRFRTRHVVVCGLGERGARLARSLVESGYTVVAAELDPLNPAIAEVRRLGALVVTGDARSGETLQRAGVHRASYLVALTGADDRNAEVALRAGELASAARPALTCLVHIEDPRFGELLRSAELSSAHLRSFRLDFFSIFDRGARALLQDHSPFRTEAEGPRIAVIGLSSLGRAVALEAARQWRLHRPSPGQRIQIALLDPEAVSIASGLTGRFSQMVRVADVHPVAVELENLDCSHLVTSGPWQAIYVVVDDDSVALDVALQARQCLGEKQTPVVVELSDSLGLAGLLSREYGYQGLSAFDMFEGTLQPELLLGGTYEILARAIHAEYVDEQRRQGVTVVVNPALVQWEELPETLKESNRDQAAHIGVKLAAIGRGIAPLRGWGADQVVFTSAEVEQLAQMEHHRWNEQRLRDGWTLGAKDIDAKVSPYLVPWSELSDDVKEWDRRAVRGIPGFLARAGYQVVSTRRA